MFVKPLFTFEVPADGGSGGTPPPAAAGAGQVPAAPANQPQTAPTSPWAESLGRAFQDEGVRGQVDQYLRTEIQPYITRREQELGQVGEVWDNLWDDDNTIPTYLSLAESIYGPELAGKVAQTFAQHFEVQGMSPEDAAAAGAQAASEQAAADQQAQQPPDFEQWLQQQPPEVREIVMNQVSQDEDATYQRQLSEVAAVEPTVKGNEERFSRYVVATEGDLNEALALWQKEMAPAIREAPAAFGWTDPAAAAAATNEPARQAPTVLGTGAAAPGAQTPPQVPPHQTMDEALGDFWADLHGQAAPGSRL